MFYSSFFGEHKFNKTKRSHFDIYTNAQVYINRIIDDMFLYVIIQYYLYLYVKDIIYSVYMISY